MLNADWGVHLPSIYRHCPRPSSGCSSMQGICAPLTGGSICLLYICTVLDLAVGVVVCKASDAQLTWDDLWCMAFCYANVFGVVVFNAHMCLIDSGVHLPSLYMYCPRSSSGCSQYARHLCSIDWGASALCLLYICIVLDLALGVVVCMASVLNWLGRATWSVMVFSTYVLDWLGSPSAFYIYALSLI